MLLPTIVCCPDPERVAHSAAALLRRQARKALAAAQPGLPARFRLALAGGSTPRRLYRLLAQPERRDHFDWQRLHIFFGDERLVPHDDEASNYRMARQAWLQHVPIPDSQIRRIKTELGAAAAAADYSQALADAPLNTVLLGMGGDGHTASLFPAAPGHQAGEGAGETASEATGEAAVVVTNSPAPPPLRVSLSYTTLNRAAHALMLVVGEGKSARLAQVYQQLALAPAARSLPAARVQPRETLHWIIDEAAAGALPAEVVERAREQTTEMENRR